MKIKYMANGILTIGDTMMKCTAQLAILIAVLPLFFSTCATNANNSVKSVNKAKSTPVIILTDIDSIVPYLATQLGGDSVDNPIVRIWCQSPQSRSVVCWGYAMGSVG